MITIYTPPGIGDVYWLLMKLLPSTNQPITIRVADAENYRGSFLQAVDGVASVESCSTMSYQKLKKLAAQKKYTKIESQMYLEANTWLEGGNRIEDYLPQLETVFRLPWKISRSQLFESRKFLGRRTVAIHTSSMKYNTKKDLGIGNLWSPDIWCQIIQEIYDCFTDVDITWIGAKYDVDMLQFLLQKFPKLRSAVEQPPEVVMSILRESRGFISYQCGLSVASVCEGIPTYMIYYDWLKEIHYSFCPPKMISSTGYRPINFTDVVKNAAGSSAKDWLKNFLV